MRRTCVATLVRNFVPVFLALGLSGCGNQSAGSDASSLLTTTSTNPVDTTLTLPGTSELFSGRAVDTDQLFANVTTNGETQRITQSSPTTIPLTAIPGETLRITVQWFETVINPSGETVDLALAIWQTEFLVDGDLELNVGPQDYRTAGNEFDNDGDSISNLRERQDGTDPFTSDASQEDESPTDEPTVGVGIAVSADVRIPRITNGQTPVIDGAYDLSYADNAQTQDINGSRLNIDNLTLNRGAIRPDGQTTFRWLATHDGTFLYLFVYGEPVGLANPNRDSLEQFWNDDSVSVFIDGNNSKTRSYDGLDDRQIAVTLIESEQAFVSNNSQIFKGVNSAELPSIAFATCLCPANEHTFEMRIPLSQLGIQVGVPFGFEIQLDLDHDGNERDANWSWFRASNTDGDANDAWRDPSVFGTMILDN